MQQRKKISSPPNEWRNIPIVFCKKDKMSIHFSRGKKGWKACNLPALDEKVCNPQLVSMTSYYDVIQYKQNTYHIPDRRISKRYINLI